jgi:hypothetical protein
MAGLRELHLLLTYQCTFECDHCFVWGSPFQTGTLTLSQIREIFRQAEEMGGIEGICLEGGEPSMYYPTLLEAARLARAQGWWVELITNAYWATSHEDALLFLRPLADLPLRCLYISEDAYHGSPDKAGPTHEAAEAARELGMRVVCITIRPAEQSVGGPHLGKGEPVTGGAVHFRGRAAERLTEGLPLRPWRSLDSCPHEDLVAPMRVHIDSTGYVHFCQGLALGNLWQQPLAKLMARYRPEKHPVCGPLLRGGPAALARAFRLPHADSYVDECHMCYEMRRALRPRMPHILGPDQMYGVPDQSSGSENQAGQAQGLLPTPSLLSP